MKGERYSEFKYNPSELASLTRIAIGTQKNSEFSEKSGISRSLLSRILNCVRDQPPTQRSLRRIAIASEGRVKINELLEVCGYDIDIIESNYNEDVHLEAQEEKNNTNVIISDDIVEILTKIKEISEKDEKFLVVVLVHSINTLVSLKPLLNFENNIDIKCGLLVD